MRSVHTLPRRLSTVTHIIHIAIAPVGALAACGGREGAARSEPADAASVRVALLTPGPISDQAWNTGAYRGLLRIRDSLGARISHIETKTPADFEENFRHYGAQGYDLVVGHGFEFQDAASRVGPEHPNSVYITTSGNRVGANVAPTVFGFENAWYLAGVIAGALTKSNVVGVIGGREIPPVTSSLLAFAAGARAVNPRAEVLTSYIGNWDDASAGKEQALAQIRRGADFIFQNADAAGLGIFQAARGSKGVYVFGSNSNQNEVAPDVIIGSVVIDLPHAFLSVAREVRERRFRPRVIYLDGKSEVVTLVLNPALRHLISPALRATLDSTRQLPEAGRLAPPRVEFVDTAIAR